MTTHIVCRDCAFEALVEGAFRAEEQVETHEDETGHRVDHDFIGHNETGRLVTDGGREKRRVQIGQIETFVYPEETVADLFDRTEGPLEVTPVNTVLCRPFSGETRPSPPDEEEYISFDLAEIEDGDALELYRLPISERPAYEEALRADGGTCPVGIGEWHGAREDAIQETKEKLGVGRDEAIDHLEEQSGGEF